MTRTNQAKKRRAKMVQQYLDRRRDEVPHIYAPYTHWARRWAWVSQFKVFMGFKL